MGLSNCITDDLTTCNNDDMGLKSVFLSFDDYPLFLNAFINIFMNTQIMQIRSFCIIDHEIKGICL